MKALRSGYAVLSWLFVSGIAIQVFLAGMVVVARQMNWDGHRYFGAAVGMLSVFQLIAAYLARVPGDVKRLNWLLFVLLHLQISMVILRGSVPVLSALHPVLALAVFGLAFALARRASQVAREPVERPISSKTVSEAPAS